MNFVEMLKDDVISGKSVTKEQALKLYFEDIEVLAENANEIRKHFCSNAFDICSIVNAKSGKCSENCKYCAQSAHYNTDCEIYPLMKSEEILSLAKYNAENGVMRYSLVTSGRNINETELEKVCEISKEINDNVDVEVCGSLGLLKEEDYKKLFDAGMKRVHNNLETSETNFHNMCTTHTFSDKVNAIKTAQKAGMVVCSGGIFGIGESVEDRIDLAFSLLKLGIKSVPVNLLNPVAGTPYENNELLTGEELRRIVAVYRFILPDAFIRLAGGRGLLEDKGRSCFLSGANAAISGDMLTTSGISIKTDIEMIESLGFKTGKSN